MKNIQLQRQIKDKDNSLKSVSIAINEILLYNCNVNSYLYLAVSNFVTKLHCKSNKL